MLPGMGPVGGQVREPYDGAISGEGGLLKDPAKALDPVVREEMLKETESEFDRMMRLHQLEKREREERRRRELQAKSEGDASLQGDVERAGDARFAGKHHPGDWVPLSEAARADPSRVSSAEAAWAAAQPKATIGGPLSKGRRVDFAEPGVRPEPSGLADRGGV